MIYNFKSTFNEREVTFFNNEVRLSKFIHSSRVIGIHVFFMEIGTLLNWKAVYFEQIAHSSTSFSQ